MATLIRTATVKTETGQLVRYYPGDDVPAEHAALITNPAAWALGDAPDEVDEVDEVDEAADVPPLPKKRASRAKAKK